MQVSVSSELPFVETSLKTLACGAKATTTKIQREQTDRNRDLAHYATYHNLPCHTSTAQFDHYTGAQYANVHNTMQGPLRTYRLGLTVGFIT